MSSIFHEFFKKVGLPGIGERKDKKVPRKALRAISCGKVPGKLSGLERCQAS